MLRSIPAWKLYEWKEFEKLEPDLTYHLDWGLAHIVQALMRDGKVLKEFMLPFGDTPGAEPVKQTVEQQERAIDAWCSGHNAIMREKGLT